MILNICWMWTVVSLFWENVKYFIWILNYIEVWQQSLKIEIGDQWDYFLSPSRHIRNEKSFCRVLSRESFAGNLKCEKKFSVSVYIHIICAGLSGVDRSTTVSSKWQNFFSSACSWRCQEVRNQNFPNLVFLRCLEKSF